MFENSATIVTEIDRNDVFCDKLLLSRRRRRSFLASKWRTKMLLSRFSKRTERIKVKNISFENFLKAQDD